MSLEKLAGWMATGWMDGWVGGRESGFKDCLQQYKMYILILIFCTISRFGFSV